MKKRKEGTERFAGVSDMTNGDSAEPLPTRNRCSLGQLAGLPPNRLLHPLRKKKKIEKTPHPDR